MRNMCIVEEMPHSGFFIIIIFLLGAWSKLVMWRGEEKVCGSNPLMKFIAEVASTVCRSRFSSEGYVKA